MDIKIEKDIMVSRGVSAKLDHVTAYVFYGKNPYPTFKNNGEKWEEGSTWYPFAEEDSGRKVPENIIDEAKSVAIFTTKWVVLRCHYISEHREFAQLHHCNEIYFPPNDVLNPTISFGVKP